ncbi:GNAT family N-acetyltransferase, partial [Pseudonocardia sp. KRD-182]|nr:GNAT family N-acetyltransferase [Pseudonocardia oceani]
MDDGITLRTAADGDRPALLRIWRRAVEATHDFLTPSDIDGIGEQVRTAALPAPALTVAQGSDGALAFHERHGFVRVGRPERD